MIIGAVVALFGGAPSAGSFDAYSMDTTDGNAPKVSLPGGITIDPNELERSMKMLEKMAGEQ